MSYGGQEALRDPPVLDLLCSSTQRLSVPVQVHCDTGVLPSLTEALLSPPTRAIRGSKVKRVDPLPNDFHLEDSVPSSPLMVSTAVPATRTSINSNNSHIHEHQDRSAGCLEQRRDEEVKEQHYRALVLQTQLQCVLKACEATLPAAREEVKAVRQLMSQCAKNLTSDLARAKLDMVHQMRRLFGHLESASQARLHQERDQVKLLKEKNDRLVERIAVLDGEVDGWRQKQLSWHKEMQDLQESQRIVLLQKEFECNQDRDVQLKKMAFVHESQVRDLQEQMGQYRDSLAEWRSAAEQEDPGALREWRQELMLGHEVELEQLKTDKEVELTALQEQLNESKKWRQMYEDLQKESQAKFSQLQEDLHHKHRMEMEGLRSR